MTSSTRSESSTLGVAVARLRDAPRFWRSGVVLAGLVASVLALRWLHIASHVYESRMIVEHSASEGAAPLDRERIERAVDDPELERSGLRALLATDQSSVIVRTLPGGRFVVLCRAEEPEVAHARCVGASSTLQREAGLRILEAATVAARPLPAAKGASTVVLVSSALFGLLGGTVWMLGRALFVASLAPRPTPKNPIVPAQRVTYAPPPPRVAIMTPSEDAQRPVGSSDDHAGAPQHALATVDPDESAAIIPISIGDDWRLDAELLEPAPDLAKLRDELCVAAAQGCFLVGVTSEPACAHLKSRLAAQLAWLLAQTEQARVLLLELDFAHPELDLVMHLDVPPLSGFSQQLQRRLHEGRPAPYLVLRCTPHLSVLPEGRVRTPGVVYSNEFSSALAQLRRHFDVIVANGPTIGHGVEARALDDLADGIVFATSMSTGADQALTTASQRFRNRRLMAAVTMPEPHSYPPG
jgi:hypothetical protein